MKDKQYQDRDRDRDKDTLSSRREADTMEVSHLVIYREWRKENEKESWIVHIYFSMHTFPYSGVWAIYRIIMHEYTRVDNATLKVSLSLYKGMNANDVHIFSIFLRLLYL